MYAVQPGSVLQPYTLCIALNTWLLMCMYMYMYVCICTWVQMPRGARRKLRLQGAVSHLWWMLKSELASARAASTVNHQAIFATPLSLYFLINELFSFPTCGASEMTQWLKCLLYKHWDLSAILGTHVQARFANMCLLPFHSQEQKQADPEGSLPFNLSKLEGAIHPTLNRWPPHVPVKTQ